MSDIDTDAMRDDWPPLLSNFGASVDIHILCDEVDALTAELWQLRAKLAKYAAPPADRYAETVVAPDGTVWEEDQDYEVELIPTKDGDTDE